MLDAKHGQKQTNKRRQQKRGERLPKISGKIEAEIEIHQNKWDAQKVRFWTVYQYHSLLKIPMENTSKISSKNFVGKFNAPRNW